MKEYRTSKGWSIFIYLFASIFIVLSSWVLTQSFLDGYFSLAASWILIPTCIAMILLMSYGVLDVYQGRLIIQESRIISIGVFSRRELNFNEIKGYRTGEQFIFVETNNKQKKQIKISKYFDGYNDISSWFSQHFLDLDDQNAIKEEQEILNDENLGWTKDIRKDRLSKAKKTSKAINWAASLTALWVFFYPTPYQYSILTAMIIPFVALLAVKFSNGLIKVDGKDESVYPYVSNAFISLSLVLMLRAILDFYIFDYSNVWLITIIITLTFLFAILIKQKEFRFKKKIDYLTVLALALFLFAYSFGSVIFINCYYDNSDPEYFKAKVLGKRISSGRRSTSHYLELSTWDQQSEVDEVRIDSGLYNKIEVNDEVNILLRNGKLEIPWFVVTEK
jgi:hypothetical protein